MKKVFWTTVVWFVLVSGFVLYMKMFNLNLANSVSVLIGATTVASQDSLVSTDTGAVTLVDIHDLLKEIQATLSSTGQVSSITDIVPVVESAQSAE